MSQLQHKDYARIRAFITSRDSAGYPIPTLAVGPPGSGKTHMAEQLADELQVQFIPQTFSPTTTDTRVVGFLSAANGAYIPGTAYSWFKDGGLWFIDEWDNGEPSAVVSTNGLVANTKARFPNGEVVTKHKNAYLFACANTMGTGATQGFRRQSQDAAARSRWAKTRLEYDEALERALSPVPEWVDYVVRVRKAVERLAKTNIWITPRDSIIGSALLSNGVSDEDVAKHLFAEFSEDALQQVIKEVGVFRSKKNQPPPTSTPHMSKPVGLDSIPAWNEANPYRKTSKKIRQYE